MISGCAVWWVARRYAPYILMAVIVFELLSDSPARSDPIPNSARGGWSAGSQTYTSDDADRAFDINADILEPGDLVFRRGENLASRLVLLADSRSMYSHVGIVYGDGPEPLVVHVVPGQSGTAPVRVDTLARFVDPENATVISVRRLKSAPGASSEYGVRAAEAAYGYFLTAVPFDARFDLETEDRVYCTELVWRAYREAGVDLVDGVFRRLEIVLGGGDYLLPSGLSNSPYLYEVLSVSRRS